MPKISQRALINLAVNHPNSPTHPKKASFGASLLYLCLTKILLLRGLAEHNIVLCWASIIWETIIFGTNIDNSCLWESSQIVEIRNGYIII